MPQPPVAGTIEAKGKLTVKRSCVACGAKIDAPNRFCVSHLTGQLTAYEVPLQLSRAVHEAGPTAPIDHPAVIALADWWKARGVSHG